jgi:hypothetical protein
LRTCLLLAALAACTDDDGITGDTSVPEVCPGPLSLEPGTGEFTYAPFDLTNGIEMVNGEQGGWHLWTAGRLCNVGPTISVKPVVIEVSRGRALCGTGEFDAPVFLDLSIPETGNYDAATRTGEFYGVFALLDDMFADLPKGSSLLDAICTLGGATIDFTIDVTDTETGETVSETTQLPMRLDPDNVADCN